MRYVYSILFTVCLFIGAKPICKSLQYNLAQVLHLNDLNELNQYADAPFLDVDNWYADRLRTSIINTYEWGNFLNVNKVNLKTLILIPMFSKESAYQGSAKSWLAFEYSEMISRSEFMETKGEEQFKSFLRHFKKINVQAFHYFEAYPANKTKQIYLELAQAHTFFKSGYSNIYQGQSMDRDLIGEYHARRFLYYFVFLIIPMVILTCFLVNRMFVRPVEN